MSSQHNFPMPEDLANIPLPSSSEPTAGKNVDKQGFQHKTLGVENAKKKLRAFSIQKKLSTMVNSPTLSAGGSPSSPAPVMVGKLGTLGSKTIKKPTTPEKKQHLPVKKNEPPLNSYAMKMLDAYLDISAKSKGIYDEETFKMECVEFGVPLGLIESTAQTKAKPTKSMPPLKLIEKSKIEEFLQKARAAKARGEIMKFDYSAYFEPNPFIPANKRDSNKRHHDEDHRRDKRPRRGRRSPEPRRPRESKRFEKRATISKEKDVTMDEFLVCDTWSLDNEKMTADVRSNRAHDDKVKSSAESEKYSQRSESVDKMSDRISPTSADKKEMDIYTNEELMVKNRSPSIVASLSTPTRSNSLTPEKEIAPAPKATHTKATTLSLQVWNYVLNICRPYIFKHDERKCYRETKCKPALSYAVNPRLCDCVEERNYIHQELETNKMNIVDRIYGCDQIPDAAPATLTSWYPSESESLPEKQFIRSIPAEEKSPGAIETKPENLKKDSSLDEEYEKFLESVLDEKENTTGFDDMESVWEDGTPVRSEKDSGMSNDESKKETAIVADTKTPTSEYWSQESETEEVKIKKPKKKRKKEEKEKKKKTKKSKPKSESSNSEAVSDVDIKKKVSKKVAKKAKLNTKKQKQLERKKLKKLKAKRKKISKKLKTHDNKAAKERKKKLKKSSEKAKSKKATKRKRSRKSTSSSSSSSSSESSSSESSEVDKKKKKSRKKKKDKKTKSSKKMKKSTNSDLESDIDDTFSEEILKNIKVEIHSDEEARSMKGKLPIELEFSPRRKFSHGGIQEIISVNELHSDFNKTVVKIEGETAGASKAEKMVEIQQCLPEKPASPKPVPAITETLSDENVSPLETLSAQSYDNVAAPIPDVAAPIPDVAAPVADVAVPIAKVAAPIASVTAPIANIAAPIANITAPIANVAAPIMNIAAPIAGVAVPIASAAAPIADVATPVAKVVESIVNVERSNEKIEYAYSRGSEEFDSSLTDNSFYGDDMGQYMEGGYVNQKMPMQSDYTNNVSITETHRIETVVSNAAGRGEIKCDWRPNKEVTKPEHAAKPSRWGMQPKTGEANIVLTDSSNAVYKIPSIYDSGKKEEVFKIETISTAGGRNSPTTDYDEAYIAMYGAMDHEQYGDCFAETEPSVAKVEKKHPMSLDDRITQVLNRPEPEKRKPVQKPQEGLDKGILVNSDLYDENGEMLTPRRNKVTKCVSFADGFKPGQDSDSEDPPSKKHKKKRRYGCAWPCPRDHPDFVSLWDALPPPPPPPGSPPPPQPPPLDPSTLRPFRPPPPMDMLSTLPQPPAMMMGPPKHFSMMGPPPSEPTVTRLPKGLGHPDVGM